MRYLRASRWLLLALLILAIPAVSHAQVFVSVRVGPPALPVYDQPPIPGPGYLWTPGYWAYGPGGYYWVPGTWVEPPEVGLLWTPGYWGWAGGLYVWHGGYWGPHVGFYGGINYGFGYTGAGYAGGYWRGREFYYNRSVYHLDGRFAHYSYERAVARERAESRVAYNGGPHGIAARPTTAELAAGREHHFEVTAAQNRNMHAASSNRAMFASENHGRPAVAATGRAGEFHGAGVVAAHPAGAEKSSANGAGVRSAEGGRTQPRGANSSAAAGEAGRGRTGTAGTPASRGTTFTNTGAAGGQRGTPTSKGTTFANTGAASGQRNEAQQGRAGQQQPHQGQQQGQQQRQAQEKGQHEGHQGEQHEGKPHKPRS